MKILSFILKLHCGKLNLILLLLLLTTSCKCIRENQNSEHIVSEPVVTNAGRLMLEKTKNYTVATVINPWQGANRISQKYFLVKKRY